LGTNAIAKTSVIATGIFIFSDKKTGMKPGKLLLSPLLLVMLLLRACGTNSSAEAAPEASFNKLQMKAFGFGEKTATTTLTVEKSESIRQFSERASALPKQPEDATHPQDNHKEINSLIPTFTYTYPGPTCCLPSNLDLAHSW
jgi:hypothetical protein